MSIMVKNQAKIHRFILWWIVRSIVKDLCINEYIIAGSYRRGKWWCNDIDLCVPVQSEYEAEGLKARLLQLGWQDRSCRNSSGLRFSMQFIKQIGNKSLILDLFCAPPGTMGNCLLFATGSKQFNDSIRSKLKDMGFSWSNPSFFRDMHTDKKISFNDESAALKFLDIKYVKPKYRK